MSVYEIRIIKREANTNFDKELAAFDERYPKRGMYDGDDHRRMSNPDYPQREKVTDSLMTELTDEQYKKVKSEIIKAFE